MDSKCRIYHDLGQPSLPKYAEVAVNSAPHDLAAFVSSVSFNKDLTATARLVCERHAVENEVKKMYRHKCMNCKFTFHNGTNKSDLLHFCSKDCHWSFLLRQTDWRLQASGNHFESQSRRSREESEDLMYLLFESDDSYTRAVREAHSIETHAV
mmetsp:Transcript_28137/g.36871  ORF Transcript_28137/g.36871 Transcript_28137/m.36871 type:complete len:154 (+) Transcript_28137:2-463(+)